MNKSVEQNYSQYMDFSDEALCALANAGDSEAEECIVKRYYGLVRSQARPLFLVGGDSEDLIQEGMFGLLRAIREYDAQKTAAFRTFAEVCIRNCLYSALRASQRDKHSPLNESVSLEAPFFDGNSYTFGVSHLAGSDPELLVIDRDRVTDFWDGIRQQLSEFEAKILGLYLSGLSCQEIAKAVRKSPKSVDNAVQRVRRKAARHLYPGDVSKR